MTVQAGECAVCLTGPCDQLNGVGPVLLTKLARLHIHTLQDLLFYLPVRYQDRTQITSLDRLQHGHWVVIEADVMHTHVLFGKRRALHCHLSDGHGTLIMVLFHFTSMQKNMLATTGARIRCFGEVRRHAKGWQMVHPEYQRVLPGQSPPLAERLTPIYPSTEGVSQAVLRKCIMQVLSLLGKQIEVMDIMPACFVSQHQLPNLADTLHGLHQPSTDTDLRLLLQGRSLAQKRLIIEELAAHQIGLLKVRQRAEKNQVQQSKKSHAYIGFFIQQLNFELSAAQQRVAAEIAHDLAQEKPMMRLLQGDVGSGKTVVAALAMLQVIECNGCVAMMVPTELLAAQHFDTFQRWFAPMGIAVAYLTGKLAAKKKRMLHEGIARGDYALVIGTHALFQKDVSYQHLTLIVIDEQHRFGVQQRQALWRKGQQDGHCPHQLVMTATPIPRTLSMVAYADLSCSVIDELPKGRRPIVTCAIAQGRRDQVLERVAKHTESQSCYWVCTLIDESEVMQCQAAEQTFALIKERFPRLSMALVHGRMSADEKYRVMQSFRSGEVRLLVATTVIEVGVDVPEATLMVIENAERLGLSQLHQLRGRIGRGSSQSHCMLLYQKPLSLLAAKRLALMRKTQDGFMIAEKDLEMRGPGEFMGNRQAGLCQFRLANLLRDKDYLMVAQQLAILLLREYPDSVDAMLDRWLADQTLHVMV